MQRWESRAFGAYLSLPVEEYALLDPSLIERIDAHSFRLAVPLGDIFADLGFGGGERGGGGAFRLVPQMVIRVEIDADRRQVTSVGVRVRAKVGVRVSLSPNPNPNPNPGHFRGQKGVNRD